MSKLAEQSPERGIVLLLLGANRGDDETGGARGRTQKVVQPFDRVGIRPLQIIEYEHERSRGSERLPERFEETQALPAFELQNRGCDVGTRGCQRWMQARDILLTLGLWLVLLWMLNPLFLLIWAGLHWLADLPLNLSRSLMPRWDIAAPFLYLIALVVLMLIRFTLLRRATLQAQPHLQSEPALELARHTAHFDVDAQELESLRTGKVRTVHVGADGHIEKVE